MSSEANGQLFAYPDTLVGTDSHTTGKWFISSWLGSWRYQAEAAMLGQPISMLIPEVMVLKLMENLLREQQQVIYFNNCNKC